MNLRYDDNEHFGSKVTWRFAPAVVIPASDTHISASAGTGFKAPTLGELYQNFAPFFLCEPEPEARNQYRL
ncbi:MAG: TonB-dependent receptor [Steroidobacteraceae bacterium]